MYFFNIHHSLDDTQISKLTKQRLIVCAVGERQKLVFLLEKKINTQVNLYHKVTVFAIYWNIKKMTGRMEDQCFNI